MLYGGAFNGSCQMKLLAESVDHGFYGAPVKLAESAELMTDIVCHAAAHPVNCLAEEQTLVIVDHYLFVFVIYGSSDAEFFKISSDDFIAYLHEVMNKYILAVGVKKVKRRLAVRKGELDNCIETLLDGLEGIILFHYLICFFGHYVFNKSRQIRIVIIKRITVDPAFADDILDRNL